MVHAFPHRVVPQQFIVLSVVHCMQSPELPSLRIEYTLSGAPDQDAMADHNSAHSLPSPDYTRAVSNTHTVADEKPITLVY